MKPPYNFAAILQPFYQERSAEELATATITIRGPFDDTILQILQTSAEQTLKAFCEEGSALIFTELEVQTSGVGNRILTLEFQILPKSINGGGDCAWELQQAAEGRDAGPFVECDDCPDKKPVIRRAILNQLQMYALSRNVPVDNWYMKMFSIYCRRLEVVMPTGFKAPMTLKDYRCEDFFPEGTRYPPADSVSTSLAPAVTGTTTTKDTGVSTGNLCSWIRDACICATVSKCSWLPDGNGIGHCVQVAMSPTYEQRCETCPTLPECPSDPVKECPLALSICACSLLSAGCNWTVDEGRCFGPPSGPSGVPCALCPFAVESCPLPRIVSVSPRFGGDLGWDGGDYDINLTFDQPVRFPNNADPVQGEMVIGCKLQEGQFLPLEAPANRRVNFVIQVPINKRVMLSDRVVQIPLGTEQFWARYECRLNVTRGAVIGLDESVPNLETRNHVVFISDNVPPMGLQFSPRLADANVDLGTTVATVTMSEPWYLMIQQAELWRLKTNAGPDAYEKVSTLLMEATETGEDVEQLRIPLGPLAPDTLFSIVIPAGAMVDRSNNNFTGLEVGEWAFRTDVATELVEALDEGLSPGAITGIVLGSLALVGTVLLCIAIQRYKLVKKFENREVKPMEGGTPKASQVAALHNDSELLPSNEKFWEKALIRSKEDLATDTLEDLPLELPGALPGASNRRPSVGSQSLTNQRRPSGTASNQLSNQLSNQRHGSKHSAGSSTNMPSNQRRPSRVSNDDRGVGSRRPSNPSNMPSNQRIHSKQSADSRSRRLSGDASASLGLPNGVQSLQVGNRSPSKDGSRSEGIQRDGRTREESESLAASRRAMLGAGPATLSKPTTPCRAPAPRQIAT